LRHLTLRQKNSRVPSIKADFSERFSPFPKNPIPKGTRFLHRRKSQNEKQKSKRSLERTIPSPYPTNPATVGTPSRAGARLPQPSRTQNEKRKSKRKH